MCLSQNSHKACVARAAAQTGQGMRVSVRECMRACTSNPTQRLRVTPPCNSLCSTPRWVGLCNTQCQQQAHHTSAPCLQTHPHSQWWAWAADHHTPPPTCVRMLPLRSVAAATALRCKTARHTSRPGRTPGNRGQAKNWQSPSHTKPPPTGIQKTQEGEAERASSGYRT